MTERRVFTFSLRPKRDGDLVEALGNIEGGDLSEVIRKALRTKLVGDVIQKKPEKKEPEKLGGWGLLK